MTETGTQDIASLAPAFSLMYSGLNEGAAIDKLRAPLSKMLKVNPGQLLQRLEQRPLLLGVSTQRDELESKQARLTHWGCQTRLEPAWRYRHWTLSQGLVEILKILLAKQHSAVFALIYVKPAPGISVLQSISKDLPNCDAYCLNHGQLLLQLDTVPAQGAGSLLLTIQQQLQQQLEQREGKAARLFLSSLALFPDDADSPGDLLDALSSRLLHFAKNESADFGPDDPSRILSRACAGRPWSRLVENKLSEHDIAEINPDLLLDIRSNWPLGHDLKPEFAAATSNVRAERYLRQFDAGSLKRIERCWDLLHDSENWDKLPSLPDVALEIYQLAQEDDATADEFTRLVSSDPALATRILSLVNSAYYGLKQKVDSLSHALIILGTQELAQLALLISSESIFQGPSRAFGRQLWRHSAMTAEIVRALALRLNWQKPSALYASALLHDVGKILLYNAYNNEMQELERIAQSNQLPMYEVEREFFGHDHATLGALMLRRWGLPEHLCQRVESHHGPLPGETKISEAAALIGVADHLAHRLAGSERWADHARLRRVHAHTLESEFGCLGMDEINQLLTSQGVQLRAAPL